ncbi:MAG TPA: tetratricopeptide repeat protein, partial [Geobacteraceae bacterium]
GRGILWAFGALHEANWHPLTWLSHMVDCELFGLDPRGHHLMSLGFHGVNTLLLFFLLHRLTAALWRSAVVAALFALHPLHVESVAWVAERKDLLAALFWLLACAAWRRYGERPGTGSYLAALILFACGLMAKPMVVTLPLVLLIIDWWPLGRFSRVPLARLIVEKLPFLLLSLASGVVTIVAQQKGSALTSLAQIPVAERLANVPVAFLRYLAKMCWPTDLAVFYPYLHLSWWQPAVALCVLAAVTVAALRLHRHAPYLAFGWLWFLVSLLPVIGIIQVGQQSLADRYTYLPLIGPFLAVVWGAAELCRPGRGRAAFLGGAVVVLVLLALTSRRQLGYWRDSTTLFTHAATAAPGNFIALTNLGTIASQQGRSAEGDRYYRAALEANPRYAQAWYNLGVSLSDAGRTAEARAYFATAVRLRPDFVEARYNLALMLGKEGRLAEAVEELAEVVRLSPDWAEAWRKLEGARRLLATGSGR